MRKTILQGQEGFTIIEVMVAAIVFLAGFSILVFLLNVAFTKFSVKEITTATHIGERFMEESFARGDTLSVDTVIVVSNISYRIQKEIQPENDLAVIMVTVKREKTDRQLCKFYGEYQIK